MAKKKKQIMYPVFFMVLVTVVFVTVLAIINSSTKDIIKNQEALSIKKNILYVLDLEFDTSKESIENAYTQYITEKKVKGIDIYYANDNDKNLGYAFKISGPGLWGSMTGYVGISSDLKHLKGVSFVSHSETPGLGGRVDEDWFKEQFRGLNVKGEDSIVFKPAQGGNADAITGATLTSDSVRKIINQDVSNFIEQVGGEL